MPVQKSSNNKILYAFRVSCVCMCVYYGITQINMAHKTVKKNIFRDNYCYLIVIHRDLLHSSHL